MKKVFTLKKMVAGILTCLIMVMTLNVPVMASEKRLYVGKDMDTTTENQESNLVINRVTVGGNKRVPWSVIEESKYFGEYSFNKAVVLGGMGSPYGGGSISAYCSKDVTQLVIFALSAGEGEGVIRITDSSGDNNIIHEQKLSPSNSEKCDKILINVPADSKTYYIYSGTKEPIKVYAAYFGAIDNSDKALMGVVIEEKTSYYNSFMGGENDSKEPVMSITAIAFAVACILFIIIVNLIGGKGTFGKLVARKKKSSADDIIYKN